MPFGVWEALWYLSIYQATIIVSLMVGLRGQGRYKQAMGELQSIARDKSLTVDEREHMLVQGVHHYCLELGTLYLERNEDYGISFKKKIKNNGFDNIVKTNKNKEVKKIMKIDEVVWKQIGYMVVGIWGFLGIGLFDILLNFLVLSPLWLVTITGIWYVLDAFILFYIHYVFNIEPKIPDSVVVFNKPEI